MWHLGQVSHHRVAHDVLAQAHGEHAFGLVVHLRTQNLAQLDGLSLGIGQFQRHVVLAGYRLHHADRDQAQGPRQVLGQAHHLRALDARRRFNLVARDHRARHGRHHTHFHAKVLEFLLDQAAGHLQRFGRHRFLALLRTVEQRHQGQAAVGHVGEQRFLALFHHARTLRHVDQDGFDDLDRLRVMHLDLGALLENHLGPLTGCALAFGQVFGHLAPGTARLHQCVDAGTQAFGDMSPRKAKHQRSPQHGQHDTGQARARKTQPAHAGRPHQIPQHTAGVARQGRLETVQARPLQRCAGTQQQHQTHPKKRPPHQRMAGGNGWRHFAPAHPVRERGQPGAHPRRDTPPDRKAQHKIAAIGQPGPQAAHPVTHQHGAAHA